MLKYPEFAFKYKQIQLNSRGKWKMMYSKMTRTGARDSSPKEPDDENIVHIKLEMCPSDVYFKVSVRGI